MRGDGGALLPPPWTDIETPDCSLARARPVFFGAEFIQPHRILQKARVHVGALQRLHDERMGIPVVPMRIAAPGGHDQVRQKR